MSADLIRASADELGGLLRSREVSAVEVAQAHLDRAAQRIDRRRNEGELRAEALARIGVRRGQGGLAEAQQADGVSAV